MFRSVDHALKFAFGIEGLPIIKTGSVFKMMGRGGGKADLTAHDKHAQSAMILGMCKRVLTPGELAFVNAGYGFALMVGVHEASRIERWAAPLVKAMNDAALASEGRGDREGADAARSEAMSLRSEIDAIKEELTRVGRECADAIISELVKGETGVISRRGMEKLVRIYFGQNIGISSLRVDFRCRDDKALELKRHYHEKLDAIGQRALWALETEMLGSGILEREVA